MSPKNTFLVTVLFLVLATVALFGIKHCNTQNTDKLLYCPDELICHANDFTYTVAQEDRQAIFDLIMNAIEFDEKKIQLSDHNFNGDISFELNFRKLQRFQRDIENASTILTQNFTFDSIKLTLRHDPHVPQIIIQYFLNGKCLTFAEGSTALLIKGSVNTYILNQNLAQMLGGLVLHEAGTPTPLASSVFPAKPDAIMLYAEGRVIEVTDAERDALYTIVSDIFAGTTVYNTHDYEQFSALEKLQGRVMLELRYNRAQQYVPDGATDEARISGAYAGTIYQSLLLSWGSEDQHLYPYPCHTDLHVAVNTNGIYDWAKNYSTHHTYQPQLTPLYAYVRLRTLL